MQFTSLQLKKLRKWFLGLRKLGKFRQKYTENKTTDIAVVL